MSRHVGFGVETTYGTAVASTDFTEALSESLQKNMTFEELAPLRTNSTRKRNLLTSSVGGDVTMLGNYQDVGLLLKHFVGTVDTTGGGPYTHTFPASTGTTGRSGLGLTCEIKRDTTAKTWRYAGCKVTGMSIQASQSQSPQFTFSFLGKSEATGTVTTASYPTFDPMLTGNSTITFSGATMPVQDLSLNCEWPVDEPFAMGAATFAREPSENGTLTVGGTATVIFEDAEMTQYGYFDGSTDVDIAIALTDGTHSLTVNMNKCKFTAVTANLSGRERLVGTFTFSSDYDTDATENIQFILINDDASLGA